MKWISDFIDFILPRRCVVCDELLSSGEKCLFALSLLLAIVENSNAPAKLLLVDDILDHLDPERIKDCFTTLYNSTIQTVIAGVQKCEHEHADEFVINI